MKKFVSIVLVAVIAFSFVNVAYASSDFKPYDDSQWFEYGDYDIHYRIAPSKTAFKGRILMLHGFLCSTYSWRNMTQELTQAGYECVMVDLPDFGYSTRETEDTQIIPREEIIEALMQSIAPSEQWIVAGHSMGGGVAINIAIDLPVKALLLYCPCPQNTFPQALKGICTSKAMKTCMNFFFEYGTKITPLVRMIIFAATNDWDFAMSYDVSGVTAPVQYDGFGAGMCEMMYNVKPTDMANVSKITCPVLICQAQKDIILTDKIKTQVNDAFPDAEKYLVQGGGHQCIENRAAELSKVTTDFLDANVK